MKEKEGYVDYPEQQLILYVEKEDGNYGPMQTGSFISANYMDDYVTKRRNLEEELKGQLVRAEISPGKYYMVLVDLSFSELAARAGIRKSRVKKHLDPKQFGCITADEMIRYGAVFNVLAANLLQVFPVGSAAEDNPGAMIIKQTTTANPYVIMTKIEQNT